MNRRRQTSSTPLRASVIGPAVRIVPGIARLCSTVPVPQLPREHHPSNPPCATCAISQLRLPHNRGRNPGIGLPAPKWQTAPFTPISATESPLSPLRCPIQTRVHPLRCVEVGGVEAGVLVVTGWPLFAAWQRFAVDNGVDPLKPPAAAIRRYLQDRYEAGAKISTLKLAVAALRKVQTLADCRQMAKDQLVTNTIIGLAKDDTAP